MPCYSKRIGQNTDLAAFGCNRLGAFGAIDMHGASYPLSMARDGAEKWGECGLFKGEYGRLVAELKGRVG